VGQRGGNGRQPEQAEQQPRGQRPGQRAVHQPADDGGHSVHCHDHGGPGHLTCFFKGGDDGQVGAAEQHRGAERHHQHGYHARAQPLPATGAANRVGIHVLLGPQPRVEQSDPRSTHHDRNADAPCHRARGSLRRTEDHDRRAQRIRQLALHRFQRERGPALSRRRHRGDRLPGHQLGRHHQQTRRKSSAQQDPVRQHRHAQPEHDLHCDSDQQYETRTPTVDHAAEQRPAQRQPGGQSRRDTTRRRIAQVQAQHDIHRQRHCDSRDRDTCEQRNSQQRRHSRHGEYLSVSGHLRDARSSVRS
jgi:hypothetical protein